MSQIRGSGPEHLFDGHGQSDTNHQESSKLDDLGPRDLEIGLSIWDLDPGSLD